MLLHVAQCQLLLDRTTNLSARRIQKKVYQPEPSKKMEILSLKGRHTGFCETAKARKLSDGGPSSPTHDAQSPSALELHRP